MEKRNTVPIHKKSEKQNIKNYLAVSLLLICGKIFERLIFNEMFNYLSANKVISENRSGFQPGHSCINQPLSITHETFTSFDNGLEVRSVFLDMSNAFDKVWNKGFIFKLKQSSISDILTDFLSNRKQQVVLNGQNLSWTHVHAGVPKESILDELLFLIYINDLSDNLTCNVKPFADDASLFSVVHDVNTSAKELNDNLKKLMIGLSNGK